MLEFMLKLACTTGPANRVYSVPGWRLSFMTHNNIFFALVSIIQAFLFNSSKFKYI